MTTIDENIEIANENLSHFWIEGLTNIGPSVYETFVSLINCIKVLESRIKELEDADTKGK